MTLLDSLQSDPDFQGDFPEPSEPTKRNWTLIALSIILGFFGLLLIGGYSLYQFKYLNVLNGSVAEASAPTIFEIQPGQSVTQIAQTLETQGYIQDELIFRIAAKLQNKDQGFLAAEYQISPAQTTQQILDILSSGQVVEAQEITIQIKPGWRIEEVASYLQDQGLTTAKEYLDRSLVKNYQSDYDFLSSEPPFSVPAEASLEGFIFPDTYFLPENPTIDDINIRILNNFQKKYQANLLVNDNQDYSGLTFYELLILGSIVEKEANLYESKRHVAQIYINRVNEGMSLGADPTVAYALGDWKVTLTYDNLQVDSPYNTRRYTGIPPGPICSPGLDSLKAMVDPADTTALFFLADREGIMRYATTNAEHEYNKRTYGLLEP